MKIIFLSVLLQGLAFVAAQNGSNKNKTTLYANLRETLEYARNKTGVPGMSVAILHKGNLVFAEGFGKRNDRDPFTAETVSMIGSITKSFTSGAVGELVAEGVVDWNTTPISTYLPEFQLQDPGFTAQITLADAFSHRTGFPGVDFSWFYNTESRPDLIKRLKYVKCGTKMQPYVSYNNVMYAVGGIAAANAADMQYEDLVREKIFKPLGLKSAGFTTEEMTKFKNYASPYNAATYEDAIEGRFNRLPLTNVADAIAPSGNIHSNVLDLVRWGQTIMKNGELDGKQVMNKDNVIETLTGQSILTKSQSGFPPEFPPTSAYGLGWVLESYKGNNNYWHNGAIDGYRSNLIMFPDSELVVGILTNAGDSTLQMGIPYYIADEILGLPKTRDWIGNAINDTKTNYELAAEAIKNAYPPQIKNAPASHKLSDFAGVYTDPLYGDLSITLGKNSKGKEELTLKLRVYESKLSHYHYDSFKTVIKYSATIFPELVSFVTDQDGKVSGIVFSLESAVVFPKKN